ncbi:helix-turn-helix transcriptional regulator [Dyella sp.]|uniref:AraC family transcriptional regulator n=1 Tax=Dyella sp. TaxID=1869338 RepID=UPI002ED30DAF
MGTTHDHAEVFQRIESVDGPELIAFVVDRKDPKTTHEYDWHRHLRGQLFYVESGLLTLQTRSGAWTLPPRRVSWMPPGELHTVRINGPIRGWGVYVAPQAAEGMPTGVCILGSNDLLRALVYRASTWAFEDALRPEQERVLAVLMDEMRRAPVEPLHLRMPIDRRLRRIAHAVLEQPQDARSLEDWAGWAGVSPRTVTRLFRSQTGSSFAQWRQQARLSHAMQRLAEGDAVANIADALGYASVSAFVAMFRRSYGQPPARYFASLPGQ